MGRRNWILMVCVSCLVLAGCDNSEDLAKEIRSMRKAGQAEAARKEALALLAQDADKPALWRELAFTDEALSRTAMAETDQRLRYLAESALIVAAQSGHRDGKLPDRKWEPLLALLWSDLKAQTAAALGSVSVHHRYVDPEPKRRLDEGFDGPTDGGSRRMGERPLLSWREADPSEAQEAIYLYARLQALLSRLPAPRTGETPESRDPLATLQGWADERHVNLATANSLYEAGVKAVDEAYAQAISDLEDLGYFQVPTIVDNRILGD